MRRLPAVAAVIAAAVAIAACGSASSNSTTSTTSSDHLSPSQLHEDAVKFADCMRSHGVPNWPDPNSDGVFDKHQLEALGVPDSALRAAGTSCNRLLPNRGGRPPETRQQTRAALAAGLAFARCMRARGFPSFPDPTSQGELTPAMVTAAGIDLHQPALLRAGLACVPVTHGLLTAAAIERAVHGG
jgi:hypothetical protein